MGRHLILFDSQNIFFIVLKLNDRIMVRKTKTNSSPPHLAMVEFPRDIWNEVMSYFHSVYKRPLHMNCMMSCEDFRRIRYINRVWQGTRVISYCSVFESYYISIVRDSWVYMTNPDLGLIPGTTQFKFRRNRSCSQVVTREFKHIYAEYSSQNSVDTLVGGRGDMILSHIYY